MTPAPPSHAGAAGAYSYGQEVEALASLIEPILIAVMGGAVGSMVITLYMAMFNIINLIKERW